MEPRNETPWNIVRIHSMEKLNEVVFPKERIFLWLIVHLPRNEVASDSHKVGLLLSHDWLDHLDGAEITFVILAEVKICDLHDSEFIVLIDFQMHHAFVVLVVGLIGASGIVSFFGIDGIEGLFVHLSVDIEVGEEGARERGF